MVPLVMYLCYTKPVHHQDQSEFIFSKQLKDSVNLPVSTNVLPLKSKNTTLSGSIFNASSIHLMDFFQPTKIFQYKRLGKICTSIIRINFYCFIKTFESFFIHFSFYLPHPHQIQTEKFRNSALPLLYNAPESLGSILNALSRQSMTAS